MLLEIIATLGLTILFTETPKIDCGYYSNGCYYIEEKIIYLSYGSDNINRTLWHEIGHSIFWNDKEAQTIIKYYPPLTQTYRKIYTCYILNYQKNSNIILEEKIADYYSLYKLKNNEFSIKYPCLFIYFRDTENRLLYEKM